LSAQRILDKALECPAQRTRSELRVIAFFG
jgi:hypothetical protein